MSDEPEAPKYEHPCTDCGGDAYVGMTNWVGPEGVIIAEVERLCMKCAKSRDVSIF